MGGEILVSSLLKELVESAGDLTFGEEREVELKGLPGYYRVYTVDWKCDEFDAALVPAPWRPDNR